jgi:hypothetical protein
MKKILYLLPVFALVIMLSGCPYSSEVAIDQPSVKINELLLGKWESKSSSDYTYTVTKTDAMNYKIVKKSASSNDETVYMGFLSDVNGTKYFNVYEDGSTTKTYYFYKLEVTTSGAKATLTPVTENITEKFTTSSELKAFFGKYQNLSFFFDKDADVYIKAD